MYILSRKSLDKMATCHKDIQLILHELIKYYDFSVLEGLRTKETQIKYFKEGKSKLDGITKLSKHQGKMINGVLTSMAVDIMPWKSGTNAFSGKELDTRRFYYMMGMVKIIADKLYDEDRITHRVRFGIDWDSDDIFSDQSFHDCPHFELV